MKRSATRVAAAVSLLLCTGAASPIGFSRSANHHAVLGRPIDLSVPLRIEPGETIDESCVSAVVMYGDTRVPSQEIRIDLDRSGATERAIRIRTATPVDEPVISVTVSAGCDAKISRKLVVFADPPVVRTPSAEPLVLPGALPVAPVASAEPQVREVPASSSAEAPAPRSLETPASRGVRAAKPVPTPPRKVARTSPPAPTPSRSPRVAAAPAAAIDPPAPKPGAMPSARISPEPVAASGARLMLDPVEADALMVPNLRLTGSVTAPDENATAKRAAAAALWRALNASPEELALQQERLAKLESDLTRLRQESVAAQTTVTGLQSRLRETQHSQYMNPLVYGLGALSLGLAGAIGYLLWRRRENANAAWWESAQPAAAGASHGPDHDATRSVVYPAAHGSGTDAEAELREGVVVSEHPDLGLHPDGVADEDATPELQGRREVSVDELIDLEQQVDFFLVLGQEEAAVDLLMSHVRSTSGSSPLPYLKLLEIYQKRGARDEYERIRERFNERFNAYAPDWESDLSRGHTLADYPQVVDRLVHLWNTPSRALEVIQASLLRRDGDVTFDLPAYRELLFLYGVARDLVERGDPAPGDPVDVELPLDEDLTPAFSPTMVQPLLATMPLHVQVDPARAPSLSVDLELDAEDVRPEASSGSVSGPRSGSIDFDPLDIQLPPPRP